MGLSSSPNSFVGLCVARVQSKLLNYSENCVTLIIQILPSLLCKCTRTSYLTFCNGDIYFLLWDTQLKYTLGLKERAVQGVEVGRGFRSAMVRDKRERPSFPCALLPRVSKARGRCGAKDAPRAGKSAEALEKRESTPEVRDAPRAGKSAEALEKRTQVSLTIKE